jgi:hypothetical protein
MANEKTLVGKVVIDSSQAEQPIGNIKKALKEANAELINTIDKFGELSPQAIAAAKNVANLKDRIGDAKAFADSFNADKKFEAVSVALRGITGGFAALQGAQALLGTESKDLEKTLVKVQGALALSQGISELTSLKDGFTNLKAVAVNTFNSIKAAIGSTGIGLLVVALGTIVTYWDDIKTAVSGVSAEQKKLNAETKSTMEANEKSLKAIDDQANILKLQGKTEREILQLKIEKLGVSIKDAEVNLQNARATRDAQVQAAQRNKDILVGILNFVTAPIKAILTGIDAIGNAVGKNFGLAAGFQKGVSSAASLIFDPEETKAEGDATIEEAEKQLTKLQNDYAGYQLQIRQIDKDASDKKKAEAEKNAKEAEAKRKEEEQKEKEYQKQRSLNATETEKIIQETRLAAMEEGYTKRQQVIAESEQAEIDKALELKNQGLLTEQEYLDRRAAIQAKYDEQRKQASEQFVNETLKDELDKLEKIINSEDAKLQAKKDALDQEEKLLAKMDKTSQEYNDRYDKYSKARIKIDEIEKKNKAEQIQRVSALFGGLSDAIGKQTAAGKAFAVAQATIDTYQAAQSAFVNAQKNPISIIGPAYPYIQAALAVVAGIKNVKSILSVPVPGGGGGGGAAPSPSGTEAPLTPQAVATAIPQEQLDTLTQSNATSRAYVVESDVTTNQERIVRLNRAARIN